MAESRTFARLRRKTKPAAVRPPPRRRRGRWNDLVGRGLFETAIVAVGVFLALMVDEWRQGAEQKDLAEEARLALRDELLNNREALIQRIDITADLFRSALDDPSQVARFVTERRNRPLLTYDSAWTMTIETGAIRWLDPGERNEFARVYGGHERLREVISHELVRWTELAAFPARSASAAEAESGTRALRIWQAYAQRSQFALCINLGRHEQALGATVTDRQLTDYCVSRPAARRSAEIYRDWRQRGWVSPTPPRAFSRNPA